MAGLEEANLANLFGRDTRGSEVGNAARVKLYADVGDIDLAREDRQTDSANLADRRIGESEDDVEIVNHEIEDDIDIEGAGSENAEAVGLKKHGAVEALEGGSNGGVEALKVAYLNDAVVCASECKDAVGISEVVGEGLFNEDVDAVLEQDLSN